MTHLDNPQALTQSSRLLLRALEPKDAQRLYEYRNQPDVMLFQGWTPQSPQEVVEHANLMTNQEFAKAGTWYQVVLALLPEIDTNQTVIGDVAFCIEPELKKQSELGIAIDTNFHGKGYALEAINALVNYLFTRFNLHRIHVSIDPENHASRKLFKRCNFREEGHLKQAVFFKGEWTDDIIMAILKSEWQKLKAE